MGRVTVTETRFDPTLFPLVLEPIPRYSDLDPSRRVGRQALIRWFEDARIHVERGLHGRKALEPQGRPGAGSLLASVEVDVLAPLRIAGDYRVGIGVAGLGTSSYSYVYGVFAGDEQVAAGRSTSVHAVAGVPTPLPDASRDALEALRMPQEQPVRAEVPQARLVRENYPFRYDVRTRFGDLDTNRHVNNVALAGWYLDGLAELHTDVLGYPTGGPLDGLAPSSLRVQYRDEVRYPGIYQLRVGVLDVDDDEVTYACGLFDGSRCVGVADARGAVRAAGDDGGVVDLSAAFAAMRMRD